MTIKAKNEYCFFKIDLTEGWGTASMMWEQDEKDRRMDETTQALKDHLKEHK